MPSPAAERFDALIELVRRLRAPDGCPWDRAQTLASLRPFVLEETHEVLEAIDRGDLPALSEELGDFIFEAVLLAQLASESGAFTVADSLASINDKLVRRHPHVFGEPGGDRPASPGAVVQKWEALKAQERKASGSKAGAMGDLPRALPSLLRAFTIGQRAAAVNFDWESAADVMVKVREELEELQHEMSSGGPPPRLEEELGDLLFAVANLARKLGFEPESALRQANEKFLRRFAQMEERIAASGRQLREMTLADLELECDAVKKLSRTQRHKDTKTRTP